MGPCRKWHPCPYRPALCPAPASTPPNPQPARAGSLSAVHPAASLSLAAGSPSNCTASPLPGRAAHLLPCIWGCAAVLPCLPETLWLSFLLGSAQWALGSDPSTPTSRLAASIPRAPCQSHGSNFPTDYPRCRHPGEKQLLYPDVGTFGWVKKSKCSLTYLTLEGFLTGSGARGWGTEGHQLGHEGSRAPVPPYC